MINKKQILVILSISFLCISLTQVYGINGTRIFGDEFQIMNDAGNPVIRVTNNGNIISNGNIQNPDFFDTSHSDRTTSSYYYVSSGFGSFINGTYLNPEYGSGIMTIGNLFLYINNINSGYQVALYRSTVGIPSLGTTPPSGDVQLTQTPTMFPHVDSYFPVPMLTTDAGLTNHTTYYYYAFRVTGGASITIASTSTIHSEIQ